MKFEWKDENRLGTCSMKWDVSEHELPMWIADMDLPTAPSVREALERRARHGVYGYTFVPDGWYEAYISWWERRYGLKMEKEWLQFSTGVLSALTSIIKRVTNVGDSVVVLSPVYNNFFSSIENTGRRTKECPLSYRDGVYSLDFDLLERTLSDPLATLLILCNPHNPTGMLWTKEELLRIGSLAKKHGVRVLSDEIHCDITRPNRRYIPFLSLPADWAKEAIMLCSVSKTFNLGGLQSAAVCVPDPLLRRKIVRGLNADEVAEPNCFAIDGAIAALNGGEKWADELIAHLFRNRDRAEELLAGSPLLPVRGDATYLVWIDCSSVTRDAGKFNRFLRETTGLILSDGAIFRGNGTSFVRLNAACSRERLEDGLGRLLRGAASFSENA